MANITGDAPAPVLSAPGPFPIGIPENEGFWSRLSSWASEHKGVVYTIAGVTLVVGAGGAIYYFNSGDSDASTPGTAANKRRKQRERRRERERAANAGEGKGKEEPATEPKKASVSGSADDELPGHGAGG